MAAAGLWNHSAQAQGPAPDPFAAAPSNAEYTLNLPESSGSASYPVPDFSQNSNQFYGGEPPVVGGYGVKGRIGAQAGTTVGQAQPFTNFDLSPYLFEGNLYLFGEARLALGNNGKTGGSLGAGGRYYLPRLNAILGGSGWLDIDNTRGATFRQWGVSTELLSEFLDIRGNIYAPYGDIKKVTNEVFEQGSQSFIDRPIGDVLAGEAQGTYLSFQRRVFSSTALQGFDTLFSIPMPGKFAQALNLETSAGFYGYEANDGSVDQTYGWRLRFDIDLFERLSHMFLEVNNDKAFKTNVAFMADINYWHKLEHRPRIGHSQYNRLAEWVRRNRTVVALDSSALKAPEIAINPATGRPYVIYQVLQTDEISHGGDGTLANPFQNLQDAINATGTSLPGRPSDFIQYVRGNSVIQSGITLGPGLDGMQVIGEQGVPSVGISVQGLSSSVFLPTITTAPFDNPVIKNVSGSNAVTINSNNTTFAGIDIQDITGGDAIFAGTGVNGGRIQSVNITNVSSGNGINLQSTTGTFLVNTVVIENIEGNAFQVTGGNANVSFSGVSQIDNTANTHASHGYAVSIEDTNGGNIDMRSVVISDTGGKGIRVYGSSSGSSRANVSFGNTTLTNTVVPTEAPGEISSGAVYIRNHAAAVTFTDVLNINGIDSVLGGDSFVVETLASTGRVFAQGNVNITNRRGHGIYVVNSEDSGSAGALAQNTVLFQGGVSVTGLGTGYTQSDSAVLFQSNSGGLSFLNGLTVNGSNGDGLEITSGLGVPEGTDQAVVEVVNGSISNVTGAGGITGTSFNLHDITKTAFSLRTSGLTISNRGTGGSTGPLGTGLSIFNFAGNAGFQGVTQINNQNGSFANAVDIQNNVSTVTSSGIAFSTLTVNNQQGVGSYAVRVAGNSNPSAGVSFGAVNVTSTGATGVSLQDNSRVAIGGGDITTTGARGIEIFTTGAAPAIQNHSVTLTSVSATASDYGIFVEQSNGSFTVTGNTSPGTGGTISTMSVAAAHFQDTQTASLALMNMTGNGIGVEAVRLLPLNGTQGSLILNNMNITGSSGQGIFAQDVPLFQLLNSSVTSNGVGGNGVLPTSQITLLATIGQYDSNGDGILENLPYNFTFNNNNIVDGTTAIGNSDMISIRTSNAISNAVPLTLSFINNGSPLSTTNFNSVTANRSNGFGALDVNWNGAVNANIVNNQFNLLSGAGQVGLDFTVNGPANVNYVNNGLSATGDLATGIRTNFNTSSTLTISGNQVLDANDLPLSGSGFVFSGLSSTAMDLTFLADNNTINLNNNVIEFRDFGSRAIVFQRVVGTAGNTIIGIGGNTIDRVVDTNDNLVESGVLFQVVQGQITLNSAAGNNQIFSNGLILGNFAPFYYNFQMPNGVSGGSQILINNLAYP